MTWRATVLTLFPEMFPGPLGLSLAGKALGEGKWALKTIDIRQFATDKHRSVDETPAGGGAGMVMRADVAAAAVDANAESGTQTIYLSPRGKPLTQARAHELAEGPGVLLLCGRFEGVDQRVLEAREMEEISIPAGKTPRSMLLLELMTSRNIFPSKGEAKRMIRQGGIYLDGQRISDLDFQIDIQAKKEYVLKVGKKKFYKLSIK